METNIGKKVIIRGDRSGVKIQTAMTREELFDKHQEEICEYCKDNILCEYQLRIGELCEGSFCERAQDEFAEAKYGDMVDFKIIENKYQIH